MLTRLLIAVNVIAYLWERFGVGINYAAIHGGLIGIAVAHGEWWRIFTAAFLHANDLHIIFNMLALWQVGSFVELIYGTTRMGMIYLFALIGGGLAVAYLTPDVDTIGASGAIFGLFSALAIAASRMGAPGRSLMQQTVAIIVINLVYGFLPGQNISIIDHVGGLIAGALFALVLYRPRQLVPVRQEAQRIGPDPGATTIEHQPPEAGERGPGA